MDIELLGFFLQQQDGKNLAVEQALDERRCLGQHLVEIKRGIDFLADFHQRGQNFSRIFLHRCAFGGCRSGQRKRLRLSLRMQFGS